MAQPSYEVVGKDANGDAWVVAADDLPAAETAAEEFRAEGLTEVRVSRIEPGALPRPA